MPHSPLRHFGLDKPGLKVGVAGLGGLGHMAVKIAVAMGCEVTVLSTSESKRDEALNVLGAKHFIVTKDADAMGANFGTLDGIINTVSQVVRTRTCYLVHVCGAQARLIHAGCVHSCMTNLLTECMTERR